MVKVSGGGASPRAVAAHLRYIDRRGELEIETDDGEQLRGKGVEKSLVADWDLDVDAAEARSSYAGKPGRKAMKLVHNVILSMPAGTPPARLLAASRDFAREQFALRHRYAMVLHTDQDHPHVHLVVKAMSELGDRLNIRKATLREWRQEFARQLREHGVAANATERAIRGITTPQKRDGIYRAAQRGSSRHMQERREAAALSLAGHVPQEQTARQKLFATRRLLERGWSILVRDLAEIGREDLAGDIRRFVSQMPPPRTENQWVAEELKEHRRPSHAATLDRTR